MPDGKELQVEQAYDKTDEAPLALLLATLKAEAMYQKALGVTEH